MTKMKVLVYSLLALLVLLSFPMSAEALDMSNYFPLAVGDEWVYQKSGTVISPQKIVVNVTAKMQPPGSTVVYYQLNNYNGQAHYVRQTTGGVVTEYPNYLWYMFGPLTTQSWTMHINTRVPGVIPGSDGAILTVVSRNEIIKVPAGTFSTVHIKFKTNIIDAGITDEWFAPGVGLVKRAETSIAGPVYTELLKAVIDGVVIGPPPVTIAVKTDKSIYWEDHMPGPGTPPAYGPVIKIFCTVLPINAQPTVLNFTDYNVWDVTIANPKGEIVWRNPKMLAPAPVGGVNRTIPGTGQTDEFDAQLVFGSMEGTYKVTAKLLMSANPPEDAVCYFEYAWAF